MFVLVILFTFQDHSMFLFLLGICLVLQFCIDVFTVFLNTALYNAANFQLLFVLHNHHWAHAAIESKSDSFHIRFFAQDNANGWVLIRSALFLIKCLEVKF